MKLSIEKVGGKREEAAVIHFRNLRFSEEQKLTMHEETKLGHRVECDGAKGTIKWIGEIPPFKDIWYGIDWDDEERGKHNGSHQGVQYFTTRYEKSGSFVRPSKINFGGPLEEAVRGRYQDDYQIEEELTDQLKRNIHARFVEVVGMEKVGKQQSQLAYLQTAVLDGWLVKDGGNSDLRLLLPRLQDLDVSNTLLSSWKDVALITQQLPNLRFLNVSGNLLQKPTTPNDLVDSTKHLTHIVMNKMLTYSWEDLMMCAKMFPYVRKIQLAYNNLEKLGPIPSGVFEHLEDVDVGMNPLCDWAQICHLGKLPKLQVMNLNNCKLTIIQFPDTPPGDKTTLFSSLTSLMMANNSLSSWESVGELDKLNSLQELVLSHEEVSSRGNYFMEYTLARIRSLKMLNRTEVTAREKRDHQIFYLRSFSNEYYSCGGTADPAEANLSDDFIKKHPSYLAIAKVHGAPTDERGYVLQKSQKLRDLKIDLRIVPANEKRTECVKSFLPATRISKLKMMIKRLYKLDGGSKVSLYYYPIKDNEKFQIILDNDMQDLQFYSMRSGDMIRVSW